MKTYSATTKPGAPTETDWFYINFGREDILVKTLSYFKYYLDSDNELQEDRTTSTTLDGYIPRVFSYGNWQSGNAALAESNTTSFTSFTEGNNCIYDYSPIGDNNFIKGIYVKKSFVNSNTYGRIRYKYAPLAYYYLLIKDYWDRIGNEEIQIDNTQDNLLDIKNKILLYELQLKKLLKEKNESILQFENDYRPFIREGYWEPSDYQSQLSEEIFDTNYSTNFSYFEKERVPLNTLNLNDSLSTYSYYFNLGNANNIDIDSIKMRVLSKLDPGTDVYIPHYQGHNYELYLNGSNLICAIDPALITQYETKGYESKYYKTEVTYQNQNGVSSTITKTWIQGSINIDNYKFYLNEENLITDKLKVYGNSIEESNLLTPYEDYSYNYESVGYNSRGEWVDLSEQESYSTDIQYKYSFRINFKLTNNTIRFLTKNNPRFILDYGKETTLQYIYNDSIATSKKYSTPQVEYSISVVDLSSLNGYEDYKPEIGQKVPIFDEEMHFHNFEGFITSINYPLEEKYNTELTIATYNTKFEEVFQKLTATMSDINYNSNEIYKAANAFETNGAIRTDVFKKSLQDNFEAVNLGVNNEITIDETEGITLKDSDNNYGVKLIGRGIFLTKDITQGTSTEWRTGITGEGINTNVLTAGSLDTKQITIWNSSEQQARFVWNEQGLFAYGDKFGTSTSTETSYQELIDYSKYVKYNQNGLEFNDNGKSALSLGWNGLRIQTQNNALQLDADKGLILYQGEENKKIRLELGVLDNGTLYGLRLSSTSGVPTFQSDSDGNLWLHQHIRLGGSINTSNKVQNPTAGIYGLQNSVPTEMQMGIRRDSSGNVIWDSTAIRFWAGPQTKNSYTTNIHISAQELKNVSGSRYFNELIDNNSPSLAKFKVSANGDIIASGIDVGGWIGEGDKLRSFNNEAILRSNGYDSTDNNYPLIAIGKPANNADTNYGSNYNFRVYENGSISILKQGSGYYTGIQSATASNSIVFYTGTTSDPSSAEFRVLADGSVTATKLTINQSAVSGLTDKLSDLSSKINDENNYITNIAAGAVDLSKIGGFTNTTTGTNQGLTQSAGSNYYVGMRVPTNNNNIVFYAGTSINNANFRVNADGTLNATNAIISGTITATAGTIGGFEIGTNLISGSKETYDDSKKGVFLGSSGIGLGPNFNVSNSGVVTIKSGSINIGSNNAFVVNTNGDVTANSIHFTGTISALLGSTTYKGVTSNTITITGVNGWQNVQIVKGLIVGIQNA